MALIKNRLQYEEAQKAQGKTIEASHRNPYITDPIRGIDLVAKIVSDICSMAEDNIDDAIDSLFASCGHSGVENEIQLASEMRGLTDLLKRPAKYRTLRDRTVVGVGGQFSSGKSRFLNTLLDSDAQFRLPTDMKTSTSVPTYIMRGTDERVMVCTTLGSETAISDAQSLDAVSHEFSRERGLNLAQYIDFISVSTPHLPIDGIALLDTPGHDAEDGKNMQTLTDRHRSLSALASADRLIWLVNAKVGTVPESDFNFLSDLSGGSVGPDVLVVVSRCDEVSDICKSNDPDATKPIATIKDALERNHINYIDVVPYTSDNVLFTPDWNDGRTRVMDFLKVSSDPKHRRGNDICGKIAKQIEELRAQFDITTGRLTSYIEDIAKAIDDSDVPFDMSSLVRLHGVIASEVSRLFVDKGQFEEAACSILDWVDKRLNA